MATVTYSWNTVVLPFFMNDLLTAGHQYGPAVAGLTNGSYFGVWNGPGGAFVDGRVVGSTGTPVANEFGVNNTALNDQYDASVAGLIGGRAVVTFTDTSTDPGGDIRARLFNANGSAVGFDFGVNVTSSNDSDSDVAALSDGGFVVSWTRDFGTDVDI